MAKARHGSGESMRQQYQRKTTRINSGIISSVAK